MGSFNGETYKKVIKVDGENIAYYSVKDLETDHPEIKTLPISMRIILESMIRNFDGRNITPRDIEAVINWNAQNPENTEMSFKVSRVLMQDFTGVPAVVDLASMRDAVRKLAKDPEIINPVVPVDLVIDHSVQVDYYGHEDSFDLNRKKEFDRNIERYRFLKWASKSFRNLRVIPPSIGIVHQVNLEYLASVVTVSGDHEKIAYPDTLVGTDSHTTMVNGIGVLGWGVGGIEAEAAMLGENVTIQLPRVVGVNLHGKLKEGITATDVVLTLTEIFRKHNVVGKFLEFYGDGLNSLSATDRATLSNMCPEYGATLALFPVDEITLQYLKSTGRTDHQINVVREYLKTQGLFGDQKGIRYSEIIDVDLGMVTPSVAGPKLPQQHVDLPEIANSFLNFMESTQEYSGSQKQVFLKKVKIRRNGRESYLTEGDVVIAAITSCTNTSNPRVMIGAGLLAKKAFEKGLRVSENVKTSLAPGSRVVSEYLEKSGLQKYLDKLGFYLVGYGCTTCIGNSGPLDDEIQKAIVENDLSTVAVLSGNRNFEARIHRDVKANYLMSPPLVIAFAIAGRVTINMESDPLGFGSDGKPVFLKDIWPNEAEISSVIEKIITRQMFIEKYTNVEELNEDWKIIDVNASKTYPWDEKSTYIRNPTYFDGFALNRKRKFSEISNARPLLVLGDSVTTDHISPAGSISKGSPAGKYLMEHGVNPEDFNTYGSRRGNHEVMIRGTFGNNRIKNIMVSKEGPITKNLSSGKEDFIYNVAEEYSTQGTPLIVFAGTEYGTGSSRDWAAKGTSLLGIKAVIARSYERIHRSNLVGMGVIPLEFKPGRSFQDLNADIASTFTITFPTEDEPKTATLLYKDRSGKASREDLIVRIDTPVEYEYFRYGGILQMVINNLLR
ncbi:MAG: aconitate hydratase AcnA [Thermoplasmataceae archaeon]|jgi:aconitate hydratase